MDNNEPIHWTFWLGLLQAGVLILLLVTGRHIGRLTVEISTLKAEVSALTKLLEKQP